WAGAGGHSVSYRFPGINAYSTPADLTIPRDIAYDHYFYDPTTPDDRRTNLTSQHGRLTMHCGSGPTGGSNFSTLWLYKANYLKLKNTTIGYTLPKSGMQKARLQDVRLVVSGENLLTFTKFPGMDPEFTETLQFYANLRQYSIGLNIKL